VPHRNPPPRPAAPQDRLTACVVPALDGKQIDDVICGADFTVALSRRNNVVWSWGWGDFGRLGHGDKNDQTVPRPVRGLASVTIASVACGDNHTLAATTDGQLFAFGRNQNGQLGLGHANDSLVPCPVAALAGKKVTSVACGAEHSLCSTEDHAVFAWGWGRYGNLGQGDCDDRHVPCPVDCRGVPAAAVVCGWRHSAVVTADGDMWTFGWSKYGQLGHGDFVDHTKPKLVEGLRGCVAEAAGGWR